MTTTPVEVELGCDNIQSSDGITTKHFTTGLFLHLSPGFPIDLSKSVKFMIHMKSSEILLLIY